MMEHAPLQAVSSPSGWSFCRPLALVMPVLLVLALVLPGCQSYGERRATPELLDEANTAYEQGKYVTAYRAAIQVANRENDPNRYVAAYIAGMSMWKLSELGAAENYLEQAGDSPDLQLAADADAALGLVYADLGKHQQAVNRLERAAPQLTGNDKAKAYLFAAISQQKLGQRAAARQNLIKARRYASDPQIREQIQQLLGVTGYTLQTGAFTKEQNARQAAQQLIAQTRSLSFGSPRILVVTKDGRRFYRVQIGSFSSFQQANSQRNALKAATGVEAIIVPLGG